MKAEKPILHAISSIYDTAVDTLSWQGALDEIAEACGAVASFTAITEFNPVCPLIVNEMSTSFHEQFGVENLQYYLDHLDKYQYTVMEYVSNQPAQTIIDDITAEPTLTLAQLEQRPDQVFMREKLNYRRRLAVRLSDNKVWYDYVAMGFDCKYASVPQASRERLALLVPHLAKAIALGQTFIKLQSKYSAVLSVLDKVNVGFAIALPSLEIILHNEEADRIFTLSNGIELTKSKLLKCRDNKKDALLKQYMMSAASTIKKKANQKEFMLTIPRASGGQPFLLEVTPLRDVKGELENSLEGALITLIDPEYTTSFKIKRFAKIYGLTKAETEVCKLLIEGLSVPEMAERRSVSRETITSQVSSIYAKSGITKRTELARLVIRVLPPIV